METKKCPICNGYGRTPIKTQSAMAYYDPNTGESFPHETCSRCFGKGWIQE